MLMALCRCSAAVKCPGLYQTLTSKEVRQVSDHQRLSLCHGTQEPCRDSWSTKVHLQELEERPHWHLYLVLNKTLPQPGITAISQVYVTHRSCLQPSAGITVSFVSFPFQFSVGFQSFAI